MIECGNSFTIQFNILTFQKTWSLQSLNYLWEINDMLVKFLIDDQN